MSDANEMIEVDVDLVANPEDANTFTVRDADDHEIQLPKSRAEIVEYTGGDCVTVELPRWLAEDRGLV